MPVTVVYDTDVEVKALVNSGEKQLDVQELKCEEYHQPVKCWLMVILVHVDGAPLGVFSATDMDFRQCYQKLADDITAAFTA